MGFHVIPSGKHTKNYGKIHHVIAGKIHYFYGHGFNSYVTNYQRVLVLQKKKASLEFCGNP